MLQQARAARGEPGVREPVAQVHNDYTVDSGPRRKRQILEAAGRLDLADHHAAFINLWRPIVGPVLDNPLALCDASSVSAIDLVKTEIQHFGESDLRVPRHTGEIYSVRHSQRHRWFYVSAMEPGEILLLKGYDSRADGRASFVPHTGFEHPDCPPEAAPRESIEARALVIFANWPYTLLAILPVNKRLEAMPAGTGLSRLAQEAPAQFFDVGIAEEHAALFAGGLARAAIILAAFLLPCLRTLIVRFDSPVELTRNSADCGLVANVGRAQPIARHAAQPPARLDDHHGLSHPGDLYGGHHAARRAAIDHHVVIIF